LGAARCRGPLSSLSELRPVDHHFHRSLTHFQREPKLHMLKRGQASLDDGDAFALTFAAPVLPPAQEEVDEDEEEYANYRSFGGSGWMVR
jgi:hypothetical protein